MRFKKIKLLLSTYWQPTIFWLVGLGLILGVLLFKLGTLTPNLSRPEVAYQSNVDSLKGIVDNPLNGPYKILSYSFSKLGNSSIFSLRTASAVYGLLTILLFYYVVSRWHDKRTAIWGTLLFATSAWFLHYARIAMPGISGTLLLAALAYGHWLRKTKRSAFVGIVGIILAAWLIYIPGMVWFVIVGGIWQSKKIGEHLKDTKLSIPFVFALGVGLLAPLVIAVTKQPELLNNLAGLPHNLPNPYDYIRHVLNVPFQIFFRGPSNPIIWLGRLPLIDVFTTTMFIIGVYTYWQRIKLDRARILAGTLIVGTLIVGLQGSFSIIALAPILYLVVTAGLSWMSKQWLDVYPRNPLARGIGITLISIVVVLSCLYNLKHYFVAWPQAPATKKVYQQKL